MENPFPGMNPYLEQYWGDVHTTFMVYSRDQLNDRLPAGLEARVEESVSIDVEEGGSGIRYPDVQVVEEFRSSVSGQPADSAVAVAEPCVIPIPDEHRTERHIEIIDPNSGNRVVTAIELLSPANKTDEAGRRAYRQKQQDYIQGRVNLVEIDLIRAGSFVAAVPEDCVPLAFRTCYLVCVRRVTRPSRGELYRASLREPLPNIPIPLRPHDRDVVLQLQPLIDQCYQRGRYVSIDYRRRLAPVLSDADEQWMDQLLREKGLR